MGYRRRPNKGGGRPGARDQRHTASASMVAMGACLPPQAKLVHLGPRRPLRPRPCSPSRGSLVCTDHHCLFVFISGSRKMETKGKTPVGDLAEHLLPTRRRDLSFYVVLFVAVIPLWSIVPLSWAFVIYTLRSGTIWTLSWPGRAVFATALAEVRPSDCVLIIFQTLTSTVFCLVGILQRTPLQPCTFHCRPALSAAEQAR